MAMQILQHGLLGGATDLDGEDVRVKRLDLEVLAQLVVVHRDRLRLTFATIDDGGHFALMTQAAARTFASRRADFCLDDKCFSHWEFSRILLGQWKRHTRDQVRRAGHFSGNAPKKQKKRVRAKPQSRKGPLLSSRCRV